MNNYMKYRREVMTMTSYLKTMLSGLRQWITAQKADWSQNDETAANFIKGRPCYDDDSGKAVPLPDKFIPATIQRTGGPVILADSSGAKWRLTVGTDGTLSTEAVTE